MTLSPNAGVVSGAVLVNSTFWLWVWLPRFVALCVTVSLVRRLAFTNFLVSCCPTDGILGAGAPPTKWLTFPFAQYPVKVVTFFVVCTVVVRSAADFQTCDQGVALHASWADTDGFVRLDLAFGISATGGGDAWVNTFLSHTSL